MKKLLPLLIFCISQHALALTPLNSPNGEKMLTSSLKHHFANSFLAEVRYFAHQDNLFFCGVASAVIILNTLHVDAPQDENFGAYKLFTQDNIFKVEALKKVHITKENIIGNGLNLTAETALFNSFPSLKAKMYSAGSVSFTSTKALLLNALKSEKTLVLVNVLRNEMDEVGGGHFSPLVAYDPKTENVLFMDVATYKYGPTWVPIKTLYKAMHTKDGNAYRGFIIINSR